MTKSKIEWTDQTWNPVTGCTKISEGCRNCYAEPMSIRLRGRCGYPQEEPFKVTYHPDKLSEPLKRKKPTMYFVVSMGDLFHQNVSFDYIAQVFAVMAECKQHIFQVLTKRPERFRVFFLQHPLFLNLPNVWLGVSAENQQTADERIPILLQIPALVRFVSCEPLLGPVDLCHIPHFKDHLDNSYSRDVLNHKSISGIDVTYYPGNLDWVICGGESGPHARPMHPDWARSLRDQCQAANVPFFFKQWGEHLPVKMNETSEHYLFQKVGKKAAGRLLDGMEYNEFPNLKH